ncbi:MAG: peptidoglycan endopeptidase [Verrucomicrobia bacterium]|nr:peptidoglycan endopeptidase [Verrucomicrobiota bacterium]
MTRDILNLLLLPLCALLCQCGSSSAGMRWVYKFAPGKTAIVIRGRAVPPANAPADVLRAIAAGNRICTKPYRRGGGHAHFEDSAYDCSGTVSYVLHAAGKLDEPSVSGAFRSYGRSGKGKWITVYARKGHVFMEVAGLRLDTGYSDADSDGPRWSSHSRPTKGYTMRHPTGL